MAYLVAKYCLVFLITGALGFVIGRWSMRRLFVDVTDSYETLSATSRAAEHAPWDEIRERFDNINNNVKTIVRNEFRANPYPELPRGLFTKLEHSLGDIKQTIAQLPAPQQVDLTAINQDIRQLHEAIEELSMNLVDKVELIDDETAFDTARKLTQEEGIICGISSGAAAAV